tara:strand:+ start:115 stop:1266 length:1152 start_codon:yes stop_codon:yes gene_type:complete
MRTIRQLPIAQDNDIVKFPDGQIQNETDTVQGTPVIREVYGDVLTNIYAIIRDAGLEPNGNEDSSTANYQLLEAFKKFANSTNDINQLITVDQTDLTVGFDVDSMPNNYVFTGILSDSLTSGENYTINGSFTLTPNSNIASSAFVMVVLNTSGCKIYDISGVSANSDVHIPFEYPVSYNSTDTVYYFNNGRTLTDYPKAYNTESLIRTIASNSNIKAIDAIVLGGVMVYLVVDITTNIYTSHVAKLTDLTEVSASITLNSGTTDYKPFIFSDGQFVYFSNSDVNGTNQSVNDYELNKYSFNDVTNTFSLVSSFSLDTNFEKTTNYFIKNDAIYTFVNGNLYQYPLNGGARVFIGYFNTVNGIVFSMNDNVYFSSGEFGSKWTI